MKFLDRWLNRANGAYFEYYEGGDGQWYWRLKAPNHEIIAVGGEGFSSRGNAKASVERVVRYCRGDLRYLPPK